MQKKYIDANIFLYAALYADTRAEACRRVLEAIVNRQCDAYASVLVWDEVAYGVWRLLGKEHAVTQAEKLLRFPHLRFLACDGSIVAKAQTFMTEIGLKPRDAIHAATALGAGIVCIVSEDADFDAVPGLQRECPSRAVPP